MSPGLVIVLAVAAGVPLLLGLLPALRLPGALLEIVVGVLIGPSVLGWVTPDATVQAFALLGLSFLLFLAGSEVDLRRFRGTVRRRVALSTGASRLIAAAVVVGRAARARRRRCRADRGRAAGHLARAGRARAVGRGRARAAGRPAGPRRRIGGRGGGGRRCCRSGSRAATPRWPAGCCCSRCCSARWA